MSTAKADANPLVPLFQSIGLTRAKALEAIKAPKSAVVLQEIIDTNTSTLQNLDEKRATLIYNLSVVLSKAGPVESSERDYVVKAIAESKLKTVDQVTSMTHSLSICFSPVLILSSAAVQYVESHQVPINEEEFNKECGVGTYRPA